MLVSIGVALSLSLALQVPPTPPASVAIEYGLYEGRFWLPRLRLAEGRAQVGFMHVPFKLEERFKYASVNINQNLAAIQTNARARMPDSRTAEERKKWRDSVRLADRARSRAIDDSVRRGLCPADRDWSRQCDTSDTRVMMTMRHDSLPVAIRIPCDLSKPEHSPDLPGSIYDPGEALFSTKETSS